MSSEGEAASSAEWARVPGGVFYASFARSSVCWCKRIHRQQRETPLTRFTGASETVLWRLSGGSELTRIVLEFLFRSVRQRETVNGVLAA
jgi:hypothetical protein